jgi:hypothetical protein
MPDFAGKLEFVREPLDGFFIEERFGPDELQGDFLADLGIVDFVNPAHAAMAQFFDDLVAAGEGRARGQLFDGRLDGFRHFRMDVLRRRKRCAAIDAKMGRLRVR